MFRSEGVGKVSCTRSLLQFLQIADGRAVSKERGTKILNQNPNQNALDASLKGGVFEGSLRSKSELKS